MADEKKINKFKLIVITPYMNFYEGRVTSVVLPSVDGSVGVMAGHTPLVVALKPGIVDIRTEKEELHVSVSEGYSEIGQNMVLIVCNAAEWPSELKVSRVFKTYADTMKLKEEILKQEDNYARKEVLKDIEQDLNRARARKHLLELYGSERQHLRLAELTEKNGPIK